MNIFLNRTLPKEEMYMLLYHLLFLDTSMSEEDFQQLSHNIGTKSSILDTDLGFLISKNLVDKCYIGC